jgi:hypothetical protein
VIESVAVPLVCCGTPSLKVVHTTKWCGAHDKVVRGGRAYRREEEMMLTSACWSSTRSAANQLARTRAGVQPRTAWGGMRARSVYRGRARHQRCGRRLVSRRPSDSLSGEGDDDKTQPPEAFSDTSAPLLLLLEPGEAGSDARNELYRVFGGDAGEHRLQGLFRGLDVDGEGLVSLSCVAAAGDAPRVGEPGWACGHCQPRPWGGRT